MFLLVLALFIGALIGELTGSPGWGVCAFAGVFVAFYLAIAILIFSLERLDRVLVRTGYYRWQNNRRIARARAKREALRRERG